MKAFRNTHLQRALAVFAKGTLLALLVVSVAFIFMNPPQCPPDYTQAQVDMSGCAIGANIGLGLMIMLAIGIEAMTLAMAAVSLLAKRKS